MIKPITTPGKAYAVTSPNGCTVTTDDGITLAEIEAGKQGYFVAVGGKVQLSDDSAILTQLFKLAPQQRLAILGVLGGNGGLPAGYKRVEYLESTGTQYINTGLQANRLSLSITLRKYNYSGGDGFTIVGAKCLEPVSIRYKITANTVKSIAWIFENKGVTKWSMITSSTEGVLNTVTVDFPTMTIKIDNTEVQKEWPINEAFSQLAATVYMALFAYGGTTPQSVRGLGILAKVYAFTAHYDGVAAANYIPALDSTGAPCMYDLVSRKPFYNQGTGDFLYPTETDTYALRRVLPDWGKLTERGLRRLYHAPVNYKGELYDYAMEHGYKPIIETEKPETGYWSPRWTETEDEIVLEWVETEPPMEEFGLPEEPLTNN